MRRVALVLGGLLVALTACAQNRDVDAERTTAPATEAAGELTVYSGRSEELVGPVIERFEDASGIEVEVKYGDTAELAALLLEERTPRADVFFAQDAGALGAVAEEGKFTELPDEILERVPEQFRSPEGLWVGTSGRARVLVYNSEEVTSDDLPDSVFDLTGTEWKGRVGWAPTNGSFQAFVTAMRKIRGDDAAREWLEGMQANDAQSYDENSAIVRAVADGEIDVGLTNHYYVLEMGAEDQDIKDKVKNHFFPGGDVGSLVNAAGVGILKDAENAEAAREFVEFLQSRTARDYFDEEVFEYPLGSEAESPEGIPPLDEIDQPDIDLSDLSDLEGTLELLRDTGAL